MQRKIYMASALYLFILFLMLAVSGCTAYQPVSALYYPPTQAEIDKRAADDEVWEQINLMSNIALGSRK